jgi:hypothetical protein
MKIEEPYFVVPTNELGFNDFNRDIIKPNAYSNFDNDDCHCSDFPDGAVLIRVDSDFWVVAALPYEYINKTIQEIVIEFWPDVENPVFHSDSDDENYWKEHWYSYHEELKSY